jgi:hypothetical protein
MFTNALPSDTIATGFPASLTVRPAGIWSALVADPIEQRSVAPEVTRFGMLALNSARWWRP